MRPTTALAALAGLLAALPLPASAADAKPKINFQDQVSTIFRNRCNGCHNADKQKGGLNLETFGTAMQGGGSGKVVEPGDPDGSTLYQLVTHGEQPNMPPNSPKIPDAELETIRAWIEGGALETSGSVAAVKAKPKFEFKLDAEAAGKPVGPPAMPESLDTEPVVVTSRANAIVAMASSPWAPVVAIGGHKQVLLYHSESRHLLGVLPFPEGTVYVLKFSRNGGLLLAAGGRGGQSGLAVVWDVKTGKRVFELGKEYDVVLAADISPDHGLVALGGPSKILRVYNTADGQLVYEQKKHTEWITAVEFSPDGVLLASGDRNNGLLVWEATTGREFYDLRGHTLAITDIGWRLDSNVVASASEDGSVRLWEMESGKQIKSISAHSGGASSVRFAKDGRLVTSGRDKLVRLWDPNGTKQRDLEPFGDLALEAVFTHDAASVIAGDWSGEVRVFGTKDGKRIGTLAANPVPLADRLQQTDRALAAAEQEMNKYKLTMAVPAEKAAAEARARRALGEAEQAARAAKSALAGADRVAKARSEVVSAAEAALRAVRNAANEALAAGERARSAASAAGDRLAAAATALDSARDQRKASQQAVADALARLKSAESTGDADKALTALDEQARRSAESRAALELANIRHATAQVLKERADRTVVEAGDRLRAEQTRADQSAREQTAQGAIDRATADRAAAEKTRVEAARAADAATAAVAARKKDVDQAVLARTAADKALAAAKPAIDAARARLEWLRSERAALALERQKARNDARTSAAVGSQKSS